MFLTSLESRKRRSILTRVRVGIRWGVLYACGFSILAAVITFAAVMGRSDGTLGVARQVLLVVVPGYFAAGALAGTLVGALLPLGRTRAGAALLGFIGGIPVYGVVWMAITPRAQWWPDVLFVSLGCALFVGPAFGYLVWRDENR
jgi:hypothetical protein